MLRKLTSIICGLFALFSFAYSLNMILDFNRYNHNGKYSGEFAIAECKEKYSDLEEISANCPVVGSSYFMKRIIVSGLTGLLFFGAAFEIGTRRDEK